MTHSATIRTTLCVLAVLAVVTASGTAGLTAAQPTQAANDPTMELSSSDGAVGETVTVELSLTGSQVAGYQAAVQYDPAVVSFESVDGADFAKPVVTDDPDAGVVRLTQANDQAVGSDVVAATLTFTIDAAGSTELALLDEDSRIYDVERTRLQASVSGGSIAAAGGGEEGSSDSGSDSGSSGGLGGTPIGGGTADSESTDDDQQDATATGNDQQDTADPDADDQQATDDSAGDDSNADASSEQSGENTDTSATDSDDTTADEQSGEETESEGSADGTPGFGLVLTAAFLVAVALIAARRN
jgi:hypothetical protein